MHDNAQIKSFSIFMVFLYFVFIATRSEKAASQKKLTQMEAACLSCIWPLEDMKH